MNTHTKIKIADFIGLNLQYMTEVAKALATNKILFCKGYLPLPQCCIQCTCHDIAKQILI